MTTSSHFATMVPPPSAPRHVLRSHTVQLSILHVSSDNERIYSGDISGQVVITSTRSLRTISSWKAHMDGLLTIEEWEDKFLTHGRDNKLHVWQRHSEPSIRLGGSAVVSDAPSPTLCYSMDVNALNYCRLSLVHLPASLSYPELTVKESNKWHSAALVALPNLVHSSLADIWLLPSQRRLHAAVGKPQNGHSSDGRGANGIIMSLHLFCTPATEASSSTAQSHRLQLLCAYENGYVILWRFVLREKLTSVEGVGWEPMWTVKLHNESIMSMVMSQDNNLALTVSADHLLGRYELEAAELSDSPSRPLGCTVHRTKHAGNSSIAIRDSGRVCAIGGWDGKIRLYSTKTLRPLGTLNYHKNGCRTVAFAHSPPSALSSVDSGSQEPGEDEDDMTLDEKQARSRWLMAGGDDGRISIWALMNFENSEMNRAV